MSRPVVWLVLLLCLVNQLAAQPWRGSRYRRHSTRDEELFYYGLGVGMNVSGARIQLAPTPFLLPGDPATGLAPDTLNNVVVNGSAGINIALVGVLRLSSNLDLRLVPTLSLQQRNVDLLLASGIAQRRIESSYIELPLLLKYKSDLYRNYRVYVITGPKLMYNFISNERVENDPELLRITRQDLGWTIGVGMDLYGALGVKIAPELSYTFGLRNVYVDGAGDIAGAIRNLHTSSIAFTIYFE